MSGILIGIFLALHGLVHLWYVTLSQRLVEFQPEMGWNGQSWLFTSLLGDATTRTAASAFYILAAAVFVISGAGLFLQTTWWRPLLIGSAIVSSLIIVLFWDGSMQQPVEKGLLGLLINVVILIVVFAR